MKKSIRFLIPAIALLLFLLLTVTFVSYGATNSGQAAYNQYCAGCHGADASGGPSNKDIRGESISSTTNTTRSGDGSMPAYSAAVISDDQLNDLARYIRYTLTTSGGDNTAPVVTSVQPSGIRLTNSATLRAYFSDSGSGINSASEVMYLDGVSVSGCSKTAAQLSCNTTGLTEGLHNYMAYVEDNAAWQAYSNGSFTVDTMAPTLSNIQPAGTITATNPTITAAYSDTGSGINSSSVTVYLDGQPVPGCTAGSSSVSCPTSGLSTGAHSISIDVDDNAGRGTSGAGSFSIDQPDASPPSVSSLAPTGLRYSTSQTITASYSDSGSGIDSATAQVYLDSGIASGCTATATAISCPKTGLAQGTHNYTVSVRDMAGNTGSASASFNVDSIPPDVNISQPVGTITTTSATISAYYTDDNSGINTATVVVTLDGTAMSGCTVGASSVSCPATGLSQGNHVISVVARDMLNSLGSAISSFTVDSEAPAVTNIQPGGVISTASATVYAYYSDAVSGINASSVSVSVDSVVLGGCTVATGSVSCPATSLAEGSHTIDVSVSDNAGNTGTGAGAFTVDTDPGPIPDNTPPSVINIQPAGTINTASPTITADYSDSDSGIDQASVAVYLDGSRLTGCTIEAATVSCPASGLSQGAHAIVIQAADNAGNPGSGSGSFTVTTTPGTDNTPPVITSTHPTGSVRRHSATVEAYFNDGVGSGIDPASAVVTLNGAPISGCSVSTGSISCLVPDLRKGRQNLQLQISDNDGNPQVANWSFTTAGNYYWTWYDGRYAINWVLMSNSMSGPAVMDFDLAIERNTMDLAPFSVDGFGPGQVPRGSSITPAYRDLMDGPVIASSLSGDSAIVSQRSLWKGWQGGNSIEEVLGIDEDRLSSHYYWTWYDQRSDDYRNWVLVANPNDFEVWYRVKIAGQVMDSGMLTRAGETGARVTPTFPGVMGGPVEVEAAADQYFSTPARVIASQRVLMFQDNAFNEMPGIPVEELSDRYLWTWYDMQSAGSSDWMLVANPDPSVTVGYQIEIGSKGCDPDPNNRPAGSACETGILNPAGQADGSDRVTPVFRGVMGGPVEVRAWINGTSTPAKVIASQRILWGESFGEVPGFPAGALYSGLSSDYHWTWYDMQSPQSTNWILVANPGASSVYYSIRIGGVEQAAGMLQPAGQPGDRVTPFFPGVMGGPVQVQAWADAGHSVPANVMASQRYLWGGYFNEVLGTLLD